MNSKYDRLNEYLKSLAPVAVAFSGGVDSTFLLKAAHELLGDDAIAVTVRSRLFPEREFSEAKDFCIREGIRRIVVEADALETEGFSENPKNRCYLCKRDIFKRIRNAVTELEIENIVEGSNKDDDGDYRPGLRAIAELGIKSPLRYAELTKAEIRSLSRDMGLQTWDKPSFACLATRFVYGETITSEKLDMVDRAEQFLFELGLRQVRVRIHGKMARIETERGEFLKVTGAADAVQRKLTELGFTYASLDLGGYRTGSMNVDI